MAFDPAKYEQYLSEARARRGLRTQKNSASVASPAVGGMAKSTLIDPFSEPPAPPAPSFFGDVGAYASAAKDQSDASLYRGIQEFSPIQGVTDWAKRKEQENLQQAEQEMSRVSPEGRAAAEGMQWEGGLSGGFKDASWKGTVMAAGAALNNPVTIGAGAASLLSGGLAVPALVGGLAGGVMGSGAASQEAEQKALAAGQSQEQASAAAHEAAKTQFLPSAVANAAEGALVVGKALNPFKSLKKATATAPVTQTAAAAGKYAAAKELGKRVATGAATEGVTEGGEELTTSMSVNNALNRELVDEDTTNRTITGGLLGAVSGGGMVAGAGGARMASQALGNAVASTAPSTDQSEFDAAKLAEERAASGETGPLMTKTKAQVIRDVVSWLEASDPETLAELRADPKSPFSEESLAALDEQVAAGETEMEKSQSISSYLSEMRGKATDDKTRNFIDVFADRLSKDENPDFGRRFAYNYAMGSFDASRLTPEEAPAVGEFQEFGQQAIAAAQEGQKKPKPFSIPQLRSIAESFAIAKTAIASATPESRAATINKIATGLDQKDRLHASIINALYLDAVANNDAEAATAFGNVASKSLAPKVTPDAAAAPKDDSASVTEESSARKLINSVLAPKATAPAADVVTAPVLDEKSAVLDEKPTGQAPESVVQPESASDNSGLVDIDYDTLFYDDTTQSTQRGSGRSKMIDLGGRKVVLVKINGVSVPFYLSTGFGGKKDVAAGKWYPFFGVGQDGWINKTSGADINNYYGSSELRAAAENLDRTVGDVREDATVPKASMSGQHMDAINAGLSPTENGRADTLEKLKANIASVLQRISGPASTELDTGVEAQSAAAGIDGGQAAGTKTAGQNETLTPENQTVIGENAAPAPLKKKPAKAKKSLKITPQPIEEIQNGQSKNEAAQAAPQEVVAPEEKPSSIDELKKMLGIADEATKDVERKANTKQMLKQETAAKAIQKEEAESAGYVEPESEAAKQQAEATQAERHPNEVDQEGDTRDTKVVRRLLTKIVDARTWLEAKTDALGDSAEVGTETAENLDAFEKAESLVSGVITQLVRGKITDPADVLAAQKFAVEVQLTAAKLQGKPVLNEEGEVINYVVSPSERITALNTINRLSQDAEGLFSKTQKPVSGLQKRDVEKAIRKWGFVSRVLGGRVRVVQSAKDIGKRYGVKGMFRNGKVYLVADHIADETDARAVLLHELGAHYGFRVDEVNKFAEEVRSWIDAPADTLQHKVAKAAMGRVLGAGVRAEIVNEELVAYAVEEAAKLNPPPASKVGMWLRQVSRAVAKLFSGNPNMTPQDLVDYAYGAAQRATTEKRTTGGDIALESVSPKAVTELASTIKGLLGGQSNNIRDARLIVGKVFRSLMGQLDQRFDLNLRTRALASMISSSMDKYHKERHSWLTSFSGVFEPVRQAFVDLSRQDPGMYKFVVDALESEEARTTLEAVPSMKAALDKVFTSGGKTMTGWDLLTETRAQMQKMVVRLKDEGVFIFNDKQKSLEVIEATEPTYWPRNLDYSKIRKNADKLVQDLSSSEKVRKAMRWKVEGEMGWTLKNDAYTNARNLVDMAASRSYDDPLYNLYGASSDSTIKKSEGLLQLGEFRGGDDDLALVVARAFSAKNNRVMNPAVVEVMRPYYQKDATQVIQSYITEAAARTGAHKSLGGWVAKDGSRYIKNYDELRSAIDRAIAVQKAALKAEGKTKPDWWIRQHAMEKLAEDGGLYYSPVAFGDYAIRRMRTLGASAKDTDWLRDTFFPAQFNMLGQDMNPTLRQAQDVAATALKVPMLFFSTLTSVVEVGNLASRIANPALGKDLTSSMAKSVTAIGKVIVGKATTPAAQKKVHDRILAHIGVVSNTITRAAMAATDSDKLLSPGLRKFTDGYFKFIGLNWWTNVVAEAAFNVAHVEIDSYVNTDSAEATRELSDLGISREQWDAYIKDPMPEDATPEQVYEHKRIHQDVYVALHKWVDGARLHPNPMTRTGWGNNPKYALLWMLNDFPYTFGAVTMGRVFKQMERNPMAAARIAYPVMIGVMFGLMGMMSNLLKDLVKESLEEGGELLGGKRSKFEPESFDKEMSSQILRSVFGSGSVFGSTERIAKVFLHMIHNYRGNAFLMNISPATSTLMGINQIGALETMINQSALFTKAQKKALIKSAHENLNAPLEDFRKDVEEYFPK